VPRVEAEVGSAASSYEILAKLATGGMAEIFLARGASTGGVERYVVLKRILRQRANDQAFVRMFLDEARLAAQLQHPNIAQVYDIGKLGDSFFFTMEYVHGETVRALLQRSHALRSPIPIGSILVIAAGAASGLHHAHERNGIDGRPLGIVHRDVSPSNLMASYEGGVKVVDFGVAKAAHRSQETRSGTVKGKISYLSPEQCRGNNVDRRSDLFSLGIVLWEMLTTERLYKRATDFEAMAAIVSEPVPPPSSRRPDVPRELDALVMQLLAKDPAERFQSADHLHEAIESVAVRIGSALSSAGLARYLRDLFGQRPEPWIEMQSRDAHPEVFTVTSEPIPADLTSKPGDALENQLGAVPDLSDDAGSESDASEQVVDAPFKDSRFPTGVPATPLPRAQNLTGPQQPPSFPPFSNPNAMLATMPGTGPIVATGPQLPVTGPQMPIGATAPQQPISQSRPPSGPMRPPGAPQYPLRDVSGPNVAPPSSYSGAYPLYQRPPPERDDIVEKKGMPRVLVIVLGAVTLGIIVGVIMAVSGGKHHATAIHDAATVVVMSNPDAPPAVAVVAPPDAAMVVDAQIATAVHPDAAPPTNDVDHTSPAERLAAQLDQGHNSDAVATCVANPALVGAAPVSCALAACRAHDAARAKKWYAAAGNKKSSIIGACKSAGITLETTPPPPPPGHDKDKEPPHDPKKDCTDPMACQH
jgi:eukaryotic-like serine/threonine-protein kinase